MEKPNFKKMCLMYIQQLTNFPYIEKDFDALTDYQLLCKVVSYLNKIITNENQQNETITALYNAFVELKDYVDNLDLQDEVNNKLDEMAESGELEELIGRYIGNYIQRTYDTNNDLINDIGLVDGMNVKTLGKLNKNDGRGCYYTISENPPSPLPTNTNSAELDNFYLTIENGLYAIPTNNINNDYYDEVTVTTERINDTTCYFTTIPYEDNEHNEIKTYVKYNDHLDISDYARKHKTTLSMNCTLGVINPDTELSENAVVISDGEIIFDNMNPPSFLEDHYKYVGIKDNRVFTDYQANITTGEQMIADGVKQAFLCFGKMVDNGVITQYCLDSEDGNMTISYPRQCIGVKLDKTIIVLTSDGRNSYDKGLTGPEAAQVLIEKGCVNVWNLDGGGSANTVYKGSRVNKYVTQTRLGISERHIAFSLNVKKPTTNENIDNVMSNIGFEKANIIKMLMPIIPKCEYKNPIDCNENVTNLSFFTCYHATNSPEESGYLINIPLASNQNEAYGKYSKQFWLSHNTNHIFARTLTNNTFTRWQRLDTLFNAEITPITEQILGVNGYNKIRLNAVSDYMPSTLTVNSDNEIETSVAGGIQVTAIFNLDIQVDTEVTIRLKKNTTTIKSVTITGKAGEKKQLIITKQLSLGASDKLWLEDFSTNNTDGANTLASGNIEILQNI